MMVYLLLFLKFAFSNPIVPVITIKDTINPGTSDYISSAIDLSEKDKAPYLIMMLDTPGGLLESTRSIVQKMLNSSIPIVVFISPKGAHAGSAGALITLASDVAVMAPSTNIGAAHPVAPGNDKLDDEMKSKITNDVSAFAEALAKAKGRNVDWAIKAVRKSSSIIADEALKEGVIDFIAEDLNDLIKKLNGFKIKMPKNSITELKEVSSTKVVPMSVKQRLVSFLANPNLAYMIMALGGLCIWVELTHPGLIFPGVMGAICILLSLISFQTLPISYGALSFIFLGMALLIAELFVPSFGVLGIGGILSFVFGSLFLMDTSVPEFQISLKLILPTATVMAGFAFILGFLVMRSRMTRIRSGVESLIGEFGEAKETISREKGRVFVQGELWSAVSDKEIKKGTIVVVKEVKNMLLVVQEKI